VTGERARGRRSKDYFAEVRGWYARDKGESTLRELLAVMGAPASG